jgi:uncharacterized protein YjiS (DUF1127 family)
MAIFPGFFTAAILASSKAALRVIAALENRRHAQELAFWDARALKDIGLTKGDLDGAMALPLHRDPTEFLSHVAAGRKPMLRRSVAVNGTSRPAATHLDRLGNLPSAEPAPAA